MYDRMKAVSYSNAWWNKRNPNYISFQNNCTNFISQCLLAGGLKEDKSSFRNKGWWMDTKGQNWSFSWSVANSLRWYLLSSGRGIEMDNAHQLQVGDIIFYDFDGNGVFQHSTIIVKKNGTSIYVNANTSDSFERDHQYKDSTAYTPNCEYSYIKIK